MIFIYEFEGKFLGKNRMFPDLKKEGWTSLPKRKKAVQKEFDNMLDALIGWKKAIARNIFHGEGKHKLSYINEAEDEKLELNITEVIYEFIEKIDSTNIKCIGIEDIEIKFDDNFITGGTCTFVFDFNGRIIYEPCLFDETGFEFSPVEFSFMADDEFNTVEDLLPYEYPMEMIIKNTKFPKKIAIKQ